MKRKMTNSYKKAQKYKEKYKNISNGIVKNGCRIFGFERLRYCNNKMDYTMPFALYLPKHIQENEKLPLFIYLHGHTNGGEKNIYPFVSGGLRAFLSVKRKRCAVILPSIPKGYDYLTDLSDTNLNPGRGRTGFDGIFSGLFERIKNLYPIDEKRVYLMGSSDGGFGVLCQLYLHPERYAAGIPMMAAANDKGDFYRILKNKPIWFVHSENDKSVSIGKTNWLQGSDILYNNLIKAGNRNLKYTRYKKCGHRASQIFLFTEKNWCGWLFSQINDSEK